MMVAELLSQLRRLDVKLWLDGDRLRYSAPKGALSPVLLDELTRSKEEICLLLRNAAGATAITLLPISRVERGAGLPLSFAQEQLWLINQFAPDSPAYNISTALRLKGPLNEAALIQTLSEIVRRHEVLRTTFFATGGRPAQLIVPSLNCAPPAVDLRKLPEAERESCAGAIASQESRRPFDLAQAPLLRTTLLRLGEQDQVVLFTMHHIVSDAWSLGILVREVTAFYEGFVLGSPPPLPEPPVQYVDFASWQRRSLQGDVLEKQLGYWKQRLDGVPTLEMPTDRPRPPVQRFRGATKSVRLSESLSRSLNELSRSNGVTIFMTLLAAFKTLLQRYCNQDDIIVGTSIANRSRPEVKDLIGFFVNTLALRTDLSNDPTVSELLERVRKVTLEAQAHQDLPFDMLVNELQPVRDPSRNPLFQVLFMLQNTPEGYLELEGLSLSRLEFDHNAAQFDLSLMTGEWGGRIHCILVYNTDLFESATVSRLLDHFQVLLEAFVADPQARLSTLPLLKEDERRRQVVEWNATRADYPKDECMHALFERQAGAAPDSVAVVFEGEQLTYGELNRRANQLAHYLRRTGVGPEVRVGVLMQRSVETLVALLGILKAGGAYIPLDPSITKERLAFILRETGASRLVTHRPAAEKAQFGEAQAVRLDVDSEMLNRESDRNPTHPSTGANHLAYVIYTSGSTGRPKGVMITHRGLVNYLSWCTKHYGVTTSTAALVHSSIAFDLTITGLFSPLLAGGRVVFIPEDGGLESLAAAMWGGGDQLLVKITPAHLKALNVLLRAEQIAGRALVMVIGGEALYRGSLDLWFEHAPETRLINEYGPTETVVGCCVYEASNMDGQSQVVPIGRPLANTECYLLDRHLREVPIGVTGEIYIGGAGVARGYLNQPDLTTEKFIPNPFSGRMGARMYKTGDLARYLPDGKIEYLGRMDRQVKVRGFRIELGEIEAALRQQAGVREALVALHESMPGDKRLIAYIVPDQETQPPSVSRLQNDLREKLPAYMMPAAFVILKELPLSANGKVDHKALPPPGPTSGELRESHNATLTEVEREITAMWQELLQVEELGVDDNFFDLGGNSLLMIQLYQMLSESFSVDLAITDLLRYPTISSLAEYISQNRDQEEASLAEDPQTVRMKEGLNRLRRLKERMASPES